MSLPPDKLVKAITLIHEIYQLKSVTVGQLQSLLGFLNFCLRIIPAGRPFLRRLYDLIAGHDSKWHHVRVNQEVRQDLMVWLEFLNHFNGRSIISPHIWSQSYQYHIYSDASLIKEPMVLWLFPTHLV